MATLQTLISKEILWRQDWSVLFARGMKKHWWWTFIFQNCHQVFSTAQYLQKKGHTAQLQSWPSSIQHHIAFLFICHYWQWPILINCLMCYYLCVLRWLMTPILALNCLLQMEQERSEEESSVGDALALAFRCAHFCSASLILFASHSPAPLFMRPRHFVRSCAICSHD